MKKVLLTESQVRLIKEEVNKNDTIQKLLFTDADKVKFIDDLDGSRIIPVVDGKKIGDKFVKVDVVKVPYNDKELSQLNIEVEPGIRHLGIAEKLFEAFILSGKPACFIYGDEGLNPDSLWGEIAKNTKIKVKRLNGNGIMGYIKKK